jgi:hypothetical protein
MNPIATHQPILFEAVRQTKGAILELGAGDSSTRQLQGITSRYILTIDDQIQWIEKYKDLICGRHKFLYVPTDETEEYYKTMSDQWGLVFIDSSTWDMRIAAMKVFKDKGEIFVIHDGNYGKDYGVNFGEYFKYWVEYQQIGIEIPTTMLTSNKNDIRKIKIFGTIKLAESK